MTTSLKVSINDSYSIKTLLRLCLSLFNPKLLLTLSSKHTKNNRVLMTLESKIPLPTFFEPVRMSDPNKLLVFGLSYLFTLGRVTEKDGNPVEPIPTLRRTQFL